MNDAITGELYKAKELDSEIIKLLLLGAGGPARALLLCALARAARRRHAMAPADAGAFRSIGRPFATAPLYLQRLAALFGHGAVGCLAARRVCALTGCVACACVCVRR